jgi:hypothetical protein
MRPDQEGIQLAMGNSGMEPAACTRRTWTGCRSRSWSSWSWTRSPEFEATANLSAEDGGDHGEALAHLAGATLPPGPPRWSSVSGLGHLCRRPARPVTVFRV